jgi:hypothetical protein
MKEHSLKEKIMNKLNSISLFSFTSKAALCILFHASLFCRSENAIFFYFEQRLVKTSSLMRPAVRVNCAGCIPSVSISLSPW